MKLALFVFAAALLMGSIGEAFPSYYDIANHDQAQAEARQRKLPLAWLGGFPEDLNVNGPRPGSQADLEQMALATLQDNAVVIFFDGKNMAPVPDLVHAQFHIQDDGPLPNGANWVTPKVVFTNPEVTQILGRVSAKEMGIGRDVPLNSALQIIRNNPMALAPPSPPIQGTTMNVAASPGATKNSVLSNGLDAAWNLTDFLNQYGLYLAIGAIGLIALVTWLAWSRRQP
jgi:hypothetical protein